MATTRRTAGALPVAQVDTVTVANTWGAGDTLTVTVGVRALVLTVGATVTTAAIATALKEMINGDTKTGDGTFSETGDNVPEFAEVAATVLSSVVTVTGRTKGKPFTLAATESTVGTGTATRAAVTAAAGPNFWGGATNWDNGVPADGDVVYLDNSDVSILYGLDQSTIEPAVLYVPLSFTGDIGLPTVNEDGAAYPEYRDTYLKIGAVVVQIGDGPGTGSRRIKISNGADPCALTVFSSGTSTDGLPAVIWKGTDSGNTLVQKGGDVGIGMFGGETAALSTFTVNAGALRCGSGVTLSGALVVNGGTVNLNSAVATSLTVLGGTTFLDGTGAVAQLTVQGGAVAYNTNGTLGGATVVSGGGFLEFGLDSRATTVSAAIDLYGTSCRLSDPLKRLGSVIIDFNQGASQNQVSYGLNFRLTRGAVA